MYTLRSKDGILKAKIHPMDALRIMELGPGHFRPYQAKGEPERIVYEIGEDSKWGTSRLVLFLWKGDILIPN